LLIQCLGELAYFLSMNVLEEVRKKHENEFIHLYHDVLVKSGVVKIEEFPFDTCYHKYIVGKYHQNHNITEADKLIILIGVATSAAVPLLTSRGVIEGRKYIDKPVTNPALADSAKKQIAIHDSISMVETKNWGFS
jgi:hypothetical protein